MKADRARLLVVAAAGIVIAHAADYALAFPDPARRTRELASTGHGYWPYAVLVAAVCGMCALALAIQRGWRGQATATSLPVTAAVLAGGQVLLFAAVETIERLAVSGNPLAFLTSVPFAVGVVLQVAVAVTAAIVLRGVEAGARRAASARQRVRRAAVAALAWPDRRDDVVVRWWTRDGDPRGPPLTLPA